MAEQRQHQLYQDQQFITLVAEVVQLITAEQQDWAVEQRPQAKKVVAETEVRDRLQLPHLELQTQAEAAGLVMYFQDQAQQAQAAPVS